VVDDIDAVVGVAPQLVARSGADQLDEQGEIAAEVPDAGRSGRPDHAAQWHASGHGGRAQPALETDLQAAERVEQLGREARPFVVVERAPEAALVGFEANAERVAVALEIVQIEADDIVHSGTAPVGERRDARDIALQPRLVVGLRAAVRRASIGNRHDGLSSLSGCWF
jgi:hypothetical protein